VTSGHSDVHIKKKKEALKIVAILKKHGFTADTFDGVKYGVIDEHHSVWAGTANSSSLVNGIGVNSPCDGRRYFLTIDSPDEAHKDYLKSKLAQYRVTPIFINGQRLISKSIRGEHSYEVITMTPTETQQDATDRAGSLRCQTNMISILASKYIINLNLAATKIQKLFRGHIVKHPTLDRNTLKTEAASKLRDTLNKSCRNYIEYQNSNVKMFSGHGDVGYKRVNLLYRIINSNENCQNLVKLANIIYEFFNGMLDRIGRITPGSAFGYREKSFVSFFLSSLKKDRHFNSFLEGQNIDTTIVDFTKVGISDGIARNTMLKKIKAGEFSSYLLEKYHDEWVLRQEEINQASGGGGGAK